MTTSTAETFSVTFEEVDPPRVRFRAEGLLRQRPEAFPLDARFAIRVVVDAFAAMEKASFPLDGQPVDAAELRRRVDTHPHRTIFLGLFATEPLGSDARVISSFAADFVTEVSVERAIRPRDDGPHETTTFSMRVRDPKLLYHCVPGFHWASAVAMTLT
jgi:hypothetical protein